MKSKIKLVSLIFLSLLYPYLLIDLMLDETAPWKPVLSNSSFFGNNWISLIILISIFTGMLYLGRSISEEKKDEPNFKLKIVYQNVITLSILAFMFIFSIFMIILVIESSLFYVSILYILFFPILFTFLHYLYTIKLQKHIFSFNFNMFFLFLGVVLPAILYGLFSAAVI